MKFLSQKEGNIISPHSISTKRLFTHMLIITEKSHSIYSAVFKNRTHVLWNSV